MELKSKGREGLQPAIPISIFILIPILIPR
jgi:hypothetical protein